jgi:hypothetical protein
VPVGEIEPGSPFHDLCLASTKLYAGENWRDREQMLWAGYWPLPVGKKARASFAEILRGVPALIASPDGSQIILVPTPEGVREALEVDVDRLRLPRRDFSDDVWLGLCIPRSVPGVGLLWMLATVEPIDELDSDLWRFGEALMSLPLIPGNSYDERLAVARKVERQLLTWYAPIQGRAIIQPGPKDMHPKTRNALQRMEEAIKHLLNSGPVYPEDVTFSNVADILAEDFGIKITGRTLRDNFGPNPDERLLALAQEVFSRLG